MHRASQNLQTLNCPNSVKFLQLPSFLNLKGLANNLACRVMEWQANFCQHKIKSSQTIIKPFEIKSTSLDRQLYLHLVLNRYHLAVAVFNQVIIFQLVFSNLIQITIIKALVFTSSSPVSESAPTLRSAKYEQQCFVHLNTSFQMFFQKTQFWADCLAERQPLAACFLTHAYSFIPSAPVFSDSIIWTGKCNWSAPLRLHYLIVPRLWLIAPICGSDDRRDRVFFRSMINNCSLEKWSKTTKRLWPWKVSNTAD